MSVIGKTEGINHGTVNGYRQHRYRQVPATEECGCLRAQRESAQDRRATNRASRARQAWNGGLVGESAAPRIVRTAGDCSAPGCGDLATTVIPPAAGLVRVEVPESREPARWYCPGWCAHYGQALADVRSIPARTPEPATEPESDRCCAGDRRGYEWHKRHNTPPCQASAAAARDYMAAAQRDRRARMGAAT